MINKTKPLQFQYEKFGKAFKKYRVIDKNASMKEVEEATGLGRATISRIESGKNGDIDSILNMCDWMNVSINSFVKRRKNVKARN